MKRQVGQFPGRSQPLTNITPIRPGASWAAWALLVLMRRVSKLRMARSLQFIHFARWQRIRAKELPRMSPHQPAEDLKNDFFLFASNYNGPWDQYIDTFARVPTIRLGMWWLWRFSRGYPGPFPIRTFKEWIRYHTYSEGLYYNAYPNASVRDLAIALEVQAQLDLFLQASRAEETAAAFRTRYLKFVRDLAPHLGNTPGLAPLSPPTVRLSPVVSARAPACSSQSSLTVVSPIEVIPSHEATDQILAFIQAANEKPESLPFSRCPMLHMARLVILDDLRPALGATGAGSLKSRYLVFMADVDGRPADFLDCLYATDPDFVGRLWGRCLGYPRERSGPVWFRRYMAACSLPVQLPFVAFPGQRAVDLAAAVRSRDDLMDWIGDHHDRRLSDEMLQQQWRDWLAERETGAVHR